MGMLICAVSDLHGELPDTPECDVLIVAGDISPGGGIEHNVRFIESRFRPWLRTRHAKHILGIGGNWDFVLQNHPGYARDLPWTYLLNEEITIGGFTFWGSPYSRKYGEWAFMLDDDELADVWATCPDDADVTITHGPPFGWCDLAQRRTNAGSHTLRERLEAVRPLLHVCGHIHEARGSLRIADQGNAGTLVINAGVWDMFGHESRTYLIRLTREAGAVIM